MKIPFDPVRLSPLAAWLLDTWSRTIRFEVKVGNIERLLKRHEAGESLIVSLWHGELFPFCGIAQQTKARFMVFVSQSKDGEIIARVLERLGHSTVRGSSTRGGVRALLQAKRTMERDNCMAAFTVDGPRGPRHKAKDGIIYLAQRAGAKIVPVRAYPERRKEFNSWDRFILPMPFTRCSLYIGEPMEVTTEKLDKEVLKRERERLEAQMRSLGPK